MERGQQVGLARGVRAREAAHRCATNGADDRRLAIRNHASKTIVSAVACNGNTNVSPAADTTFTLTATGPGGTATATASVAVQVQECHSITYSACPTGATQFCVPAPIVATSSSHAQAACDACYGAGACTFTSSAVCGEGWVGLPALPPYPLNALFYLFVSGLLPWTPGDIMADDGPLCVFGPVGRWAP